MDFERLASFCDGSSSGEARQDGKRKLFRSTRRYWRDVKLKTMLQLTWVSGILHKRLQKLQNQTVISKCPISLASGSAGSTRPHLVRSALRSSSHRPSRRRTRWRTLPCPSPWALWSAGISAPPPRRSWCGRRRRWPSSCQRDGRVRSDIPKQTLTRVDVDSLVLPCDLQQVVVVTDKRVEPDALVCAGDLQRRGGVSCNLESYVCSKMNQGSVWLKGSLPIKLKTSFIKSLKPTGEHKEWSTCSWWDITVLVLHRATLIFQIQRGRVLSSVVLQNDLINTSVLLGNLSERAENHWFSHGKSKDFNFAFIGKGKLSLVLCWKHIYDAKAKKHTDRWTDRRTDRRIRGRVKSKHSQAEQKPEMFQNF